MARSAALESDDDGQFFVKHARTTLGQIALLRGDTLTVRRELRKGMIQNRAYADRGAEALGGRAARDRRDAGHPPPG